MLKIACPQCRQLVARTFDLRRCMRAVSSLWQRSERLNFSTSVRKHSAASSTKIDLAAFPPENIRNFSIIAHVDHGKSTLADRLLELTGTIPTCVDNQQVLDRLQVERERGITVKAQTASLLYDFEGKTYLLNLIDTPGHVDFNYEVCRSLSACQGVVLLVDANQGVQAQTVANFYLAFEMEKVILPVLNKIDLKNAKPDTVIKQLHTLFEIESEAVLKVSAKFGTGITELIAAIIQRIPPPSGDSSKPLKALVFDSWYDRFKGAIVNVALFDGILAKGDKIVSASTTKTYEVQEVGILHPLQESTQIMYAGQVGYVIANIRDIHETHIGDTFYHSDQPVEPLAGFQPAKPMVFAGIYPPDQSEYDMLRKAIEKLILNDSSVTVYPDSSPALGQGWRLGFLGLLHMEVFNQRLEQEYNTPVIATAPNVPYRVKIFGSKHIKKYRTDELTIVNPCHLPSPDIINEYLEPMVLATIITPDAYLGCITSLYLGRRGIQKDQYYIDGNRILIKVILPLNEILIDFYDELKSATSGYASFDYEDHGYQTSSLVKVMFLLNGKEVEELTMISHTLKARQLGKEICAKLKDIIPQQLFTITIQAAVGAKIIAREDVKALRKDVTAKCYGGDVSRKKKLLKRQAEGKKRMRRIGNIEIPKDAFMKVLKK